MNPHRLGNKNSKEKTRPKSTGNYFFSFHHKYLIPFVSHLYIIII